MATTAMQEALREEGPIQHVKSTTDDTDNKMTVSYNEVERDYAGTAKKTDREESSSFGSSIGGSW